MVGELARVACCEPLQAVRDRVAATRCRAFPPTVDARERHFSCINEGSPLPGFRPAGPTRSRKLRA